MADIPSIPGRDQNTSSGSARYRSASAQISAITIVLARLDEAERRMGLLEEELRKLFAIAPYAPGDVDEDYEDQYPVIAFRHGGGWPSPDTYRELARVLRGEPWDR